MTTLTTAIREALLELEQWRQSQGWAGPDEYHPDTSLHHPMTVGAWGRTYAVLARHEASPVWAAGMVEAGACLLDEANRTGLFRHACWGLPFAWHDNPPHFPYLITTALAAGALLDSYVTSGRDDFLSGAVSAGRWMLEENGWITGPDGTRCFHYAPCDGLRIPIHNVNAMAAGYLAELAQVTDDDAIGRAADEAVAYLLATQAADGSWRYQEDNLAKGPESHTGYILGGMAHYLLARPQKAEAVLPAFRRGLTFYCERQFRGPCALHTHAGDSTQEGRLWAQGWGVAACALAHRVTGEKVWLEQAMATAKWALDHLRQPNGAFRMRTDDNSEFPRQIAHMAYGLAFLLRELTDPAN